MQQESWTVDLGNLIEHLQGNLYSGPLVAFRELLTNARDSLVRRWGNDPDGQGRIEVRLDQNRGFTIADNGEGMSEDQIRYGLAQVAGSFTRLMKLDPEDPSGRAELLSGQFGLGFLSSFMLAYGVDVRTTVPGRPGEILLWRCFGGRDLADASRIPASWTLERTTGDLAGTEVTLYLHEPFLDLSYPAHAAALIARYADLTEFPILLTGRHSQVNYGPGPWHDAEVSPQQLEEFLRRRGQLRDGEDIVTVFAVAKPGLGGALFLPAEPDAGALELHCRNILVGQNAQCLPADFPFLRGVVDCRDLTLMLSRESVVDDRLLTAVRQQLRGAFLEHLGYLRDQRQGTFGEVVRTYGRALKRAASDDPDLLQLVGGAFMVRVGTSGTEMTLGQVMDRAAAEGTVYYMDDPASQSAYAVPAAMSGIPVVDVSDRNDLFLLHAYAELLGVPWARVDTRPAFAAVEAPGWEDVEHLLLAAREGLEVHQANLPDNIVALFQHDQSDEMADWMRRMRGADGQLPEQLRDMGAAVDFWRRTGGRARVLYLNIDHALAKALRDGCARQVAQPVLLAVARAVIDSAELQAEHLDGDMRAAACDSQSQAAAALLSELLQRLP